MRCENCKSTELDTDHEEYVCKKCGHRQLIPKQHYTYPLDGGVGQYAKKRL